jgi:hypothetical protein
VGGSGGGDRDTLSDAVPLPRIEPRGSAREALSDASGSTGRDGFHGARGRSQGGAPPAGARGSGGLGAGVGVIGRGRLGTGGGVLERGGLATGVGLGAGGGGIERGGLGIAAGGIERGRLGIGGSVFERGWLATGAGVFDGGGLVTGVGVFDGGGLSAGVGVFDSGELATGAGVTDRGGLATGVSVTGRGALATGSRSSSARSSTSSRSSRSCTARPRAQTSASSSSSVLTPSAAWIESVVAPGPGILHEHEDKCLLDHQGTHEDPGSEGGRGSAARARPRFGPFAGGSTGPRVRSDLLGPRWPRSRVWGLPRLRICHFPLDSPTEPALEHVQRRGQVLLPRLNPEASAAPPP